jgi:hypothetical protein
MSNELFATQAVYDAFTQVVGELSARLLEAAPVHEASTSASPRAVIPAGSPTPSAQAPDLCRPSPPSKRSDLVADQDDVDVVVAVLLLRNAGRARR